MDYLDHFSSSGNDVCAQYIATMKKHLKKMVGISGQALLIPLTVVKNLLVWIQLLLMQHTDLVKAVWVVA